MSILPASLIAVVSLTLAIASTDLAKRNALVRRMDAIETLSGVSDVCSDKVCFLYRYYWSRKVIILPQTGTITLGRMVLQKAWIPAVDAGDPGNPTARAEVDTKTGQLYSVETGSDPYYPRGAVLAIPPNIPIEDEPQGDEDDAENLDYAVRLNEQEGRFKDLTLCASLCNVATLSKKRDGTGWWVITTINLFLFLFLFIWIIREAHGDPTEIALQVFAHKLGLGKPHLTHKPKRRAASPHRDGGDALYRTTSAQSGAEHERPVTADTRGRYELIVEHPFDSTIKRMSTAWRLYPHDEAAVKPKIVMFMKGAVERLFDRSTHVGLDSAIELTEEHKAAIIERMDILAAEGLRVLTLCGKQCSIDEIENIRNMPRDEFEQGFSFLGLVGI